MDKKIIVNMQEEKEPLGDLFGIFFEDLNHAADGGLYAEMVQNRSFEFDPMDNKEYHSLYGWEKVKRGNAEVILSIDTLEPYSEKNPHYLVIDVTKPGKGAGVIWDITAASRLKKEKYICFPVMQKACRESRRSFGLPWRERMAVNMRD